MKRRTSERGEVITAFMLLGMWFAGLMGVAAHTLVENKHQTADPQIFYRLGVDYNSGNTQYICEEPSR